MLTLSKAAVPVACICILAASVMFVWAVIGVVSFSGTSPTHFGGFGRAMLTLSTATSMDGWIAHATEMHGGQEGSADAGVSAGVTLYFISYIVVLWFVMTGVRWPWPTASGPCGRRMHSALSIARQDSLSMVWTSLTPCCSRERNGAGERCTGCRKHVTLGCRCKKSCGTPRICLCVQLARDQDSRQHSTQGQEQPGSAWIGP